MIRFNGRGNEGHETFILFKQKPKSESWQRNSKEYFYFCKTARKPYDVAVGLVLLRAEKNAPGVLKVSSDGDWEHDWADIQDAYRKVFEDEPVCPFVEETVQPNGDMNMDVQLRILVALITTIEILLKWRNK